VTSEAVQSCLQYKFMCHFMSGQVTLSHYECILSQHCVTCIVPVMIRG
jgi:hypothetical protein